MKILQEITSLYKEVPIKCCKSPASGTWSSSTAASGTQCVAAVACSSQRQLMTSLSKLAPELWRPTTT